MTVTYDIDQHIYRDGDEVVPGVTDILTAGGLIDTRYFTDEARDRGTRVAVYTSLDDEGDLDELAEPVQPYIRYIQAWRSFLKERRATVVHNEKAFYDKTYRYAGTVDRVVGIDGALWLIDIKTGGLYPSYGPQTAAYANLVGGIRHNNRMAVLLKPNGSYVPKRYKDPGDWSVFASALVLYHFRKENGLIK